MVQGVEQNNQTVSLTYAKDWLRWDNNVLVQNKHSHNHLKEMEEDFVLSWPSAKKSGRSLAWWWLERGLTQVRS